MNSRTSFLGLSIFFILITFGLSFVSFMAGKTFFTLNGLTTLSFSILSFSVWYLYADFSNQDERAKYIRKKTINFSYFILVVLIVVFYVLSVLNVISLDTPKLFQIITSTAVIILSISWIIITKKN
ncbi:hypothetical protein [Bacillus cereus]|uniref:Permease n=3 Tax=Bacillus cereus group TaxID=86661 RepID=A0A6I7EDX3_BACCE|nr:hypothetical protein [Bacillus cereus]HDR7765959.1 hypothetical protein [Bacillus paranthracis]AJI11374.1 putative membrane protein [Bacillus cereus 03BB108]EDX62339.1 hypothetical protein BC03BB108_5288 [Bacillus cereus 03BB108]PEW70396.1 hypothetical protein CN448_11210 [Bacillus cereus]QHV03611.1 hypothetical protein C1N82_09730 [Bacillus cereus]